MEFDGGYFFCFLLDFIFIEDGVDIIDLQIDDVQYLEEFLILDKFLIEILMYICNFLDVKFLVCFLSKVCRSFQDLFVSDIYWKIRIKKKWLKLYLLVYGKFQINLNYRYIKFL